jgi:oxygen-independent coproporphyrinogen-3 oxidase
MDTSTRSFIPSPAIPTAQLHLQSEELARRMAAPQRHRLLQGYPMAPLMRSPPFDAAPPIADLRRARPGVEDPGQDPIDRARQLIVGVLPHTFCNPTVRGCGFCTFPHEKLDHSLLARVTHQLTREIARAAADPALGGRAVEAVYFGGGTANLTPPAALARLAGALERAFDLRASEVTLEGVPRYFLLRDGALLDVLAGMAVRHRRISMGVQTFDDAWLARMGRAAFGGRDVIAAVVAAAHDRGFTASADLLFNLPVAAADGGAAAARALSLADVAVACDLGFDQICVYNLVLGPDLGTGWAADAALVGAMPPPAGACATWLAVRAALLARGYVQTTLTNFERADVAAGDRRFAYERASFQPATRDAIGFGPAAISTFTTRDRGAALKWINELSSAGYVQAMAERDAAAAAVFRYTVADLKLLHLTRGLALLGIESAAYRAFFGSEPIADFAPHIAALEAAGLMVVPAGGDAGARSLTPEGMFYADAVAGLLASGRVTSLRSRDRGAVMYTMG